MEKEIQQALTLELQKKWEILPPDVPSDDNLQLILAERIAEMLKDELENLLFIMYRMDIDEQAFQNAMKLGSIPEISQKIAELVIKRELQKIHTRKFFV